MALVSKGVGLLGDAGAEVVDSLFKLLAKGKADGTVVSYPDELIESTPFELRKAIADHNESVLGPEYRESFGDTTFYRGGGSERSALKNDVWMSSDPYQASTYAGQIGGNVMPLKVRKGDIPEVYSNSPEWNRIGLLDSSMKIPRNEYPEELGRVIFNSEQSPYAVTDTNKIAQFAKDEGFGGVSIKGLQDIGPYQRGADLSKVRRAESLMLGDGSNARSVNAAFDPAKESSRNLLASKPAATIGAGILGYLASSQNAEAGAGGTLLKNVMPAPQRMFDPSNKDYKPFLSDFEQQAGGRYLEMGPNGPVDITGTYPATANISVSPDGKPKFQVAGEERTGTPPNEGRKIKTNLFKKKAGWKWSEVPEGFDPNPAGNFPLVSVEDGKNHYYTVDAQFPDGAELARYPNSTSEPRLRPTRKGKVELGSKIGEIDVRGKKHPVYDKAVIREGATGAGILGALAASQSNDTYADYSPENLARLRTDDVGSYQAAQSPQLARAAGLMGQVNERGVDDPLMGMVSPRIPSELMNKIAYNDKRGVADYLKAAAGLLGLY